MAKRHLRKSVAQGVGLILLGLASHMVGADGAAIFFWFYGAAFLLADVGKIIGRNEK